MVQLDHEVDIPAATAAAVQAFVFIVTVSYVIYTMPPYVTTDPDLAQVCTAITAAVGAATEAADIASGRAR